MYGFNDDNTKLLDTLEVFLGNEFGENMIIGGDFNVTLNDEIDKKHGKANTHKKQRIKLKQLMETFNLNDIWRIKKPKQKTVYVEFKSKPTCILQTRLFSYNKHIRKYNETMRN